MNFNQMPLTAGLQPQVGLQAGLLNPQPQVQNLPSTTMGPWSQLAYQMAGSPHQGGGLPSVAAPPAIPGSLSATGSSGGGAGTAILTGLLGAVAKNPALLKGAYNGISGLLGSGTPSVLAGGSPALSTVGTGAVEPAVNGAAADASAALADTPSATGGLLGAGAGAGTAVAASGAGSALGAGAPGVFASGNAAAGSAGVAGAGLAGVAGVAALPALVYGLMSIYDKPGLANNLANNYAASGQVSQHTDPQLAAQYGAALQKAQAGGGMSGIAGDSALANQNTGNYYTTSSGKRLDAGFSPSQAASLYNAAYVDPKLASPTTVNAYLAYMQQHGG